jgi:hypothetical protein
VIHITRWERLSSNYKLLLAIRWYLGRLKVDRYVTPGRPQFANKHVVNASWRLHLKAARRVLGLKARKNEDGTCAYWLPYGYRWNLRYRVGLDLDDAGERAAFELLPDYFPLGDELTERFSEKHGWVLEQTKQWLERPRAKKTPQTRDPGVRRLNVRAKAYLSELMSEEE